jgi:glycosyltransferase involved in cell wall biosynthesis
LPEQATVRVFVAKHPGLKSSYPEQGWLIERSSKVIRKMDYPRITVVTPSFNQAQFLEETILSVIGQHYPNLEYIIMDGGSTDNSVQIIKKYEQYLAYWVSKKDGGQANAINEGFVRSTGDILGWVNSDDLYLPGILHFVAANLDASKSELLMGNCFHFREGLPDCWGSNITNEHATVDLVKRDYVIQPSTFWTRKARLDTGPLNETLNFVFDWDWFIRAQRARVNFKPHNKYLSLYRFHGSHKTSTGGERRRDEKQLVTKKYSGLDYVKLFPNDYLARVRFTRRWLRPLKLARFEIPLNRFASRCSSWWMRMGREAG